MFGFGTAGTAATTLGHDWWQGKQNVKQRDAELEQQRNSHLYDFKAQQDQQGYMRKMWEDNNKYNSPSEQMTRFKEAGLNPHLIYGKGTSGNSAAPAQAGEQLKYNKRTIRNMGQGMKALNLDNLFTERAQINNLDANTAKVQADKDNAIDLGKGIKIDNVIKGTEATHRDKKLTVEINKILADTDAITKDTTRREEKHPIEMEKLRAEINKTNWDSDVSQKRIQEIGQNIKESASRITLNEQKGVNLNTQSELNNITSHFKALGMDNAPYLVKMLEQNPDLLNDAEAAMKAAAPQYAAPIIAALFATMKVMFKKKKVNTKTLNKKGGPTAKPTRDQRQKFNSNKTIKPNTDFLNNQHKSGIRFEN